MKDFDKIEELFRDNLSGFEADPGAGVWESISQNLSAGKAAGASATGGAAAKISVFKWIAGITLITGSVGIGAVYLSGSNSEEKTEKTEEVKSPEKEITAENKIEEEKTEVALSEVENKAVLQQSDVIVKDEKKQKTIMVSVKENPKFNMNKSSVDSWVTKRNNYTVNNSSSNNDNAVAVITPNGKTENPVTIEVKEVDESKPIAAILQSVSGGPAPLTVTFSNATNEKSYEWNINGYIINEESYTHIFEVPGTYKVKLTVKNAKGIKSTDEVEITVGEQVKPDIASKFSAKKVNVFTPNNDGVNDFFFIDSEFENIESFLLQITNYTNGEVIFETTDPDFKWDGRMRNGEILPTGKYLYHFIAIGKDDSKYKDSNVFSVTK